MHLRNVEATNKSHILKFTIKKKKNFTLKKITKSIKCKKHVFLTKPNNYRLFAFSPSKSGFS